MPRNSEFIQQAAECFHILTGALAVRAAIHTFLQIVDVNVGEFFCPDGGEIFPSSFIAVYSVLSGSMGRQPAVIQLLKGNALFLLGAAAKMGK